MGLPLHRVALMLAFILLKAQSSIYAWNVDSFPNPTVDVSKCGRHGMTGWVCDADGLVSDTSLNVIEGHIRAIYNGKDPYRKFNCGNSEDHWQVAVAVLNHIDGHEDPAVRMEKFAVKLHNRWGVGSRACGGGALLVLSVQDKQMYISSGRAALKHLTKSRVRGILERMKSNLRAGKYGTALEQAVVEMGLYLSEAEGQPEEQHGDEGSSDGWLIGGLLSAAAGLSAFSWYRGRKEQRQFRDVKAKLTKMQQDLRDANENRYLSTTCPICLEDFEGPPRGSSVSAVSRTVKPDPEARLSAPLLADDASSSSCASDPKQEDSRDQDGEALATGDVKAGGEPKSVKAPFLLPCGHTFCEPCVMKWLETHTACPVCRKPIHGASPSSAPHPPPNTPARDPQGSSRTPPPQPSTGSCYHGYGVRYTGRPYLGRDMFSDELAFRMMMMRRRYPQYITPAMEQDMVQQAAEGGNFNWVQHRDFQARDPQLRAERARQGSSNTSFSFGGGASHGGSGGSW